LAEKTPITSIYEAGFMRGLYKLYHVISITIASGNYKPTNITGGFLAVALFSGLQTSPPFGGLGMG